MLNSKLTENDITDELVYQDRRRFCQQLAIVGLLPSFAATAVTPATITNHKKNTIYKVNEKLTDFEAASTYNNFYEFSVKKDQPHQLAKNFKTDPWSLEIDGLVAKPQKINLEDLLKKMSLEERIYRFRCVEAWSMVIPWIGFPISQLLKIVEPLPEARFVRFETLYDPKQFPGQRKSMLGFSLKWPYKEGLTLAEAKHDLAILAVGMYGKVMPNQNGAPIRLIVPWKYGFKGIKSIVKISLTKNQPETSWNVAAPAEYGFYANVNPAVDHPRWSQKKERRITSNSLFSGTRRIETLPFNGYQKEVAHLYKNLDLKRYY